MTEDYLERRQMGERILGLMRAKGMTQKELAGITGLTESAVSNYVNGHRWPHATSLMLLKDALGCTWEELLDG